MTFWIVIATVVTTAFVTMAYWWALRQRNMDRWIGRYYIAKSRATQKPEAANVEILISVCDHYEPEWNRPPKSESIARVDRWVRDYPLLFGEFADSDGRPPQHTFFFPQDEYQPEYLDRLASLVTDGFGDVDVHLHHDHDTPEGLTEKLETFRDTLFDRHGLLRRHPETGEIVYGFIHGNWALCNSRPDGRWCGVDHEIPILLATGCYADFTMPSAPSNTQTRTINSIYFATDKPGRAAHEFGRAAVVGGGRSDDELLMIQGPLVPDWSRRKFGVLPRIENGDLQRGRAPSVERLKLWLRANVHVGGAPERVFVKLHTHGCKDGNIDTLLGPETVAFHRDLAEWAASESGVRYRYVTAYEMAQEVEAAVRSEAGAMTEARP